MPLTLDISPQAAFASLAALLRLARRLPDDADRTKAGAACERVMLALGQWERERAGAPQTDALPVRCLLAVPPEAA